MESLSAGAASLSATHRSAVAVALTTPENAAARRELRHHRRRRSWRAGARGSARPSGLYQRERCPWRHYQRHQWRPPPPPAPGLAPAVAPGGHTAATADSGRPRGSKPVDGTAAAPIQWDDPTPLLQTRRPQMPETTNAPASHFTTGQVARLTGLTHRQLDHWAWSGFLAPASGEAVTSAFARRRYTFEDLVRIRTVAELRRQGASLQLVQKAVERLQQFTVDPLRQLKLVVLDGEVYIYRSWAELERATDGQLAFTFVDVGAVLRQLEGQLATLRPRVTRQRAPTEIPSSAVG